MGWGPESGMAPSRLLRAVPVRSPAGEGLADTFVITAALTVHLFGAGRLAPAPAQKTAVGRYIPKTPRSVPATSPTVA
jgi:hypothetical protein